MNPLKKKILTREKPTKLVQIALLLIIFPMLTWSQTYSEKRVQGKSFKLKSGIMIQVSNKYGNVNIMPWDKDSVRFEVSIAAQSKQASRVAKILSSIDCEMISTASFISATTVFHDNSATFWKDVVSYAGKVVNTSNNLQIDYTVYMPLANPLKVENKFGNIYMGNQKGNADLILSNGDLQARDFSGNLKLRLEFGSATIQNIERGQLDINYSDFSAQGIKNISISSRSSTFDIENAGQLDLASVRDKFSIRTCNSISGETSFSRIKINSLEASCTLNTKYGELKLNGIERNFRNIYIKSEYTDVLLGFDPPASFSADLQYDSKTTLNFPPQVNSLLKKEILNAKYEIMKSSGDIGKSTGAQLTVSMKSGSLSLLNK